MEQERLTVELLNHIADMYIAQKAVAESKGEWFQDFYSFLNKELRSRKEKMEEGGVLAKA